MKHKWRVLLFLVTLSIGISIAPVPCEKVYVNGPCEKWCGSAVVK